MIKKNIFLVILFLGFHLASHSQNINYAEAMQKVVWFLETQRVGKVSEGVTLPDGTAIPNRVNWRSDSYMSDGKAIANDPFAPAGTPDLTGGLFDAGDPPKWSPGLAHATTMLSWGILEYPNAYKNTNLLKYSKGNIKWLCDYFLKCFRFDPNAPNDVSKYRIYLVVGGSGGGSGIEKYQGTAISPAVKTLNEQAYIACQLETVENSIFNLSDYPNYQRPVYYADRDAPATCTVTSIAGALASASAVFRGDGTNAGSAAYADLLLERAKMLLNFANAYMVKEKVSTAGARSEGVLKNRNGNLVDSEFAGGRWDNDARQHRPAVSYPAYLCWASLWVHEAELKKNAAYGNSYLTKAVEYTNNAAYPFPPGWPAFEDGSRGTLYSQVKDDWNHKPGRFSASIEPMCYMLLAKYLGMNTIIHHTEKNGTTNGKTYGQMIESLADGSLTSTITESGMPDFAYPHLALSGMQSATFCMLVSADKLLKPSHPNYPKYIAFAKQIVDYTLGENKYNRSFLVGFNPPGKIPTLNVLHTPAMGFWDAPVLPWTPKHPGSDELGDFSKAKPRHICYGGLVGPAYDGSFDPNGYDPRMVEVGPVYQKGFEGNLARMVEVLGSSAGSVLPNFPSPEATDGKEYYVRVKQLESTGSSIKLSALIVNHSAWPAVMKTNMSFRYYFTKEAGTAVTVSKQANTGYPLGGIIISNPVQASGDTYFVEVSFPNIKIYPGGSKESSQSSLDPAQYPRIPHYEKEVVFTLTSSGAWNNSNDWSYAGVGQEKSPRGYSRITNIPVYDRGIYLAGNLPPISNPAICSASGSILREVWPNIGGISIPAVPAAAPSAVSQLPLFESPANAADNYLARVRGFVCPPQTGLYTFWISGDDNCELWLSTTDSPGNKVKIASVPGWTFSREWTKYPSQRSVQISLNAGQKYYIEALHKEGGGADNLAVGWELPNGIQELPIPGSRLSPVQSTQIAARTSQEGGTVPALKDFDPAGSSAGGGIALYPNPVGDELSIRLDNDFIGNYSISVFGASGLKVLSDRAAKTTGQLNFYLDTRSLPRGVYLVEISNGDGKIFRKILKQ